MLCRSFTALFFLLLSIYTSGQAIDTVGIKGANDINISRSYKYWEDKSRKSDAQEALRQFAAGSFKLKTQEQLAFNSGPTASRFWMVLYVKNDTTFNLPLLWSFYNNDLTITFYEIDQEGQPVLLDSLSHLEPYASRYPKVRMPAYFFQLQPNIVKNFLIAIEAVQTDYVYFYSDISTVEDVLAWESGYSLTNGLYAGFFLFVLIINLCLGILLRQQIHFWHGAYVLSVLCYTLSENMLDVLLLPQWLYAGFAQIPKIFFLVISVFFSTKVFQLFVRQQERYGFMHRVFKVYRYCLLGFIIIGVVAVIVAYPGFIRAGVFYQCCKVILLTGNFLLAANVLWGIIKKDKLVIAYAIASFLFFISVTDYVLVAYGKLNWLVITPGKITVSLTIEIFILTLYFIYEQQARLISIVKGLRQSQSEKLVLVNELVNAEDNEKQRLAKDLHDDLGNTINRLLLVMNKLRKLTKDNEGTITEMESLLHKAHEDVRNISHELMPLDFKEEGLETSLRKMCAFLSANSKTAFQFFFTGKEEAIPGELRLVVYRIFTELSNNILKHAQATQAVMQCTIYPAQVLVTAEDNGVGMNANEIPKGIGLRNLYSRIKLLNGKITTDTGAAGTTILIEIPLLHDTTTNRAYTRR